MEEQIIDSVALATQDVVNTIGHYQSQINTLETVVTMVFVAFAAVAFLAVRWGMKVYNAKKNNINMEKY